MSLGGQPGGSVSDDEARVLLDELADELVGRGFPEALAFAVAGRPARRARSSALYLIGFEDGRFLTWYQESAERNVLARSSDFAPVRDAFVHAVENEARRRGETFEERR